MFHRLRQIAFALRFRTPPPVPADLIPDARLRRMFRSLGAHDQRHLLEVHRLCVESGLPGHVAMGALLHDLGKARLSGSRISVAGRTWHLLFGRFAPDWERRLSRARIPIISNELFLAYHHAEIGAERLAALGYPPEVVEIVRKHDAETTTDHHLRAMQAIDSATP
ncbi:MAG: HDOD domain-containing protein [Chloroflexota bacterium]|nr:HDOD domain-containing protein [Chloroflexota bacterium]